MLEEKHGKAQGLPSIQRSEPPGLLEQAWEKPPWNGGHSLCVCEQHSSLQEKCLSQRTKAAGWWQTEAKFW